jgi:predicted PurR-regulated permease PerM
MDVLKSIVENGNNNSLLLFFIAFSVVLIILVPTLFAYMKYKVKQTIEKIKVENDFENKQFSNWTEREKNLIEVIKESGEHSKAVAEAITKLTVVLDANNAHCETCKKAQLKLWEKVDIKLEAILTKRKRMVS